MVALPPSIHFTFQGHIHTSVYHPLEDSIHNDSITRVEGHVELWTMTYKF
jgi:hypothetical protein